MTNDEIQKAEPVQFSSFVIRHSSFDTGTDSGFLMQSTLQP